MPWSGGKKLSNTGSRANLEMSVVEERESRVKKIVYIFGAGKNGKELLELLNENQKVEVAAFIDNDEKKHGKCEGGG